MIVLTAIQAFLIGCFIGLLILCFWLRSYTLFMTRIRPPPPVVPPGGRPRPEPGIVIQEGIMPEAPSGVRWKSLETQTPEAPSGVRWKSLETQTKVAVRDLIKPLSRYEIARGRKS